MSYKGSILVVDDTPVNLAMLVSMLSKRDYTVHQAMSGTEALEMAHELDPDLILLDIMMPDMNGFDVCQQLKDDPTTQDIPVIFISAVNDIDGIIRAFDVGGVDYVTKPFQLKEVHKRVESHITLVRQRKQIEAMREQERQQFETINAMREKFIYAATHDLKNPLQLITGYVEVMRGDELVQQNPDFNSYLDNIIGGARKIMTLVGDMLDLIQMETSMDPAPEPTDINAFLASEIESFRFQAEQKDLDIHLHAPEKPIIAEIDPKRIAQVMENLISNAIKYTPEGGAVTVSLETDGVGIVLAVSDTGLGIPEKYIPTLFQPFARVREKEHMRQDGTGLGLAIVKTIIDQHGGKISVDSVPGEGTTFTIFMPRVVVAADYS